MTGRRVLRGIRIVLALVVAGTFVDSAAVRAQEAGDGATATLAGFQGSAAASGLHALYNPEGLLPIPPPVDIGAPDALATIASGPATFARASVADPGDLLANPDALLALFSSDYPAGSIPPYPFRVSATSGIGEPVVDSNPAPGLTARVEVGDGTSSARASTAAVDVPAIATVGTMASAATTRTDGSEVSVHARSRIGNIDVLGLLKIESIVTDLTATSSGGDTELEGGTTVVGAELAGQPVIIDEEGVHAAPGSSPLLGGLLAPLTDGLNELLKAAGIHITAAGPVEQEGGSSGELASSGLRIDLEFSRNTQPALADLLDAIPPIENPLPGLPSIEDLLVAAQARHLVSIELGRGVVSLAARTSGAVDPPPPGDVSVSPGIDLPASSPGFTLAPTAPAAPGGGGPQVPVGAERTAQVPVGAGVGALVLLALLALPFVGERIAWICTAVLAADGADACTLEGR